MVGAQEHPYVQVGAVVELADLQPLIQVGSAVTAKDHFHEVLAL